MIRHWLSTAGLLIGLAILSGCATLPPGSAFPKVASAALTQPEQTTLGEHFASAARDRPGSSGFRIIPAGADGFLTRMQMINAAERTLDLQYFIFRGDNTGKLLTQAVLQAADRGVRVRILVDDGETVEGDSQINALEAHRAVEVRIFNPFVYRGHVMAFRAIEYAFNISRLDYRMHNKLLIVDNAIALVGGRNIGDQYFQIIPDSQFADDDVLTVGPVTQKLSVSFDEFWNSALSIPAKALSEQETSHAALAEHRDDLSDRQAELKAEGADYLKRVATGEPLNGILSGRLPLIWAPARLISDSPDKRQVENGSMVGRLMHRSVAAATKATQSELLMITPYLIPGQEGMQLFDDLRKRGVRVRILTSSLESSTVLLAQSGYMHYRVPLLASGVELYEIRSLLGNTQGSGQTKTISRHGNYSLHAKLFVFDRKQLFIGSMNFDQRSMHLNTEIGLIIDSPELAQQVVARFEAMTQPANAYQLLLRPNASGATTDITWHTMEDGHAVEYDSEPARSLWQKLMVNVLTWLPLDKEL